MVTMVIKKPMQLIKQKRPWIDFPKLLILIVQEVSLIFTISKYFKGSGHDKLGLLLTKNRFRPNGV